MCVRTKFVLKIQHLRRPPAGYFLLYIQLQVTYSFLPWDGTLPIHQVHGPIWILSGNSNKSLCGLHDTQNISCQPESGLC